MNGICMPIKKGRGITRAPSIANNRETGNRPTAQRYQYIPVDFFKGWLTGIDRKTLVENPLLQQYFHTKGDEIEKEYYQYRNMKFRLYQSGRMTIEGSLHKYWNNGEHNHN